MLGCIGSLDCGQSGGGRGIRGKEEDKEDKGGKSRNMKREIMDKENEGALTVGVRMGMGQGRAMGEKARQL